MKKIFILLLLSTFAYSQNDTLYLLIDNPIFNKSEGEKISTGFAIVSKDSRFITDYYKFTILNFLGWDNKGDNIFIELKDLKKEINVDSVNFETILGFSKNKKYWEIHNELSLIKYIYIIEKVSNNSVSGGSFKYYVFPVIYEGTSKNVIPTDMSNDDKNKKR